MKCNSAAGRAENVKEILIELIGIPSVTGTDGEARIARHIHEKLSHWRYFRENSSHLRLVSSKLPDVKNDIYAVFALVKAARPTTKTILFIAHFDVVDVSIYGSLKPLAFDPPALERAMADVELPPKAKKDLESGQYLFGRGAMDMKAGLALELDLIEEFSNQTNRYDVNIAVLAIGDEENNNGGMRIGARFMKQAAKELRLDVACVVNTEPSDAGKSGTEQQMIFMGTIGKLLPFFYVRGAGVHAGSYFQGMSASLLMSFLHTVVEANPDLVDADKGEVTVPPLALGLELRHREYSVTLPDKAATFFNYFFLKKTPSVVLDEMTAMAHDAVHRTKKHLARSYAAISARGYTRPGTDLMVAVLTFRELVEVVRHDFAGDLDEHLSTIAIELADTMDVREKGIILVEALLELRKAETPVIVTGLLPPFLPPRESLGSSAKEIVLQAATEKLQNYAEDTHGVQLEKAIYFAGISDLSYVGSGFSKDELRPVAENIPGWGDIYVIPFEEIAALDAPVINIGPMGRDAHKMTERLEKDYTFRILPDLLRYFVKQL
jgi:arginine utilization protein RocB